MADRLIILEPSEPPETGHQPVGHATSFDKAVERATERVMSGQLGRGSVLIQVEGTNEVWSVQRHPEGTIYEVVEDAQGRPTVTSRPVDDVEVRIVKDATEEELETDDEGTVKSRKLVGDWEQTDIPPGGIADG